MTISFRNITLKELVIDDLEFLRQLRNQNRAVLVDKVEIDKDNQGLWFAKLDKTENNYFKISHGEDLVGFIFAKNIDSALGSFETGVFVSNEFKGSAAVSLAALVLSFYYFNKLNFKRALAYVHMENHEALTFNKSLEFKMLSQAGDFYKLELLKESYVSFLTKYRLKEKFERELLIVLN